MFFSNLSHEFKLIYRSSWFLILFSSIGLLFLFATFNGKKNVEKRLNDILKVQEEFQKKDLQLIETLKKIESGEDSENPYWRSPSDPMTIGSQHPRLALMHPGNFSFLAIGQSDMFTHFKSPTIYGNNFALDYSEMINPIQLLFGNFDLAFAIIYILPLLIISFTYNILSKEKELGTLRLLSSQPISTMDWLFQKTLIRFIFFVVISLVLLLSIIAYFFLDSYKDKLSLIGLVVLVISYNLFWFVLAFIVNIKINNSSKNAISLIGIWLFIVLVIPATINQIGNSLYPAPSRLKMINEIRLIKKENEEAQNKIMDEYLRTHPELAKESDKDKFGFWHNYFASEKEMENKTKPLLTQYDTQLKKQQDLIYIFKFLSPAILMHQSFNNIAGTSEKHYNDYKKQVFQFSEKWRNYLVPMLFKNQKFSLNNYKELPNFKYENRILGNVWSSIFILNSISFIILILFLRRNLKFI